MIAKCHGCPNKSELSGLFQEERIRQQYKVNGDDWRVFTECRIANPKERTGCCTACGTRRTFHDKDTAD